MCSSDLKCKIQFLEEIIEGQTSTTVMALEIGIILHRVNISACLILIALGIPTDRTAEVVEIRFDPLEFLKA